MKKSTFIQFALVATIVIACKKNNTSETISSQISATPILPEVVYDYSDRTEFSQTPNDAITLGRVLFYDRNLSASGNMSCGNCHKQEKGFADNVQFHSGITGIKLNRNTLSITGNSNALFWDGRSSSLNELALLPIQNHNEMGMNLNELIRKINSLPYYSELIQKAYGTEEMNASLLQQALTSFCSVLSTKPFSFIDTVSFTIQERQGFRIFHSLEGKCFACHDVLNNNRDGYFNFSPPADIGLDVEPTDVGVSSLTRNNADKGKFKIPNLRNVALTAPYMHDGRYKTLEEVVEHYNSGVKPSKNLSIFLKEGAIKPVSFIDNGMKQEDLIIDSTATQTQTLNLSEEKKKALVAFLKKLTDNTIATDYRLSDPFRK
jgi:cytochrome c peroxidase